MSGLPWARLDSNIYAHDKVIALLTERGGYHAFTLYICSLAWSVGQGTDGFVQAAALLTLHGSSTTAALLIKHELWEAQGNEGWRIHNFDGRQQTRATTEQIRQARSEAGRKGGLTTQSRRRQD
jgi:hypothetical protein